MISSFRIIVAVATLVAVVSAAPHERIAGVSVPITKVKSPTTVKNAAELDRTRAAEIMAGRYGTTSTLKSRAASASATNSLWIYTIDIAVGDQSFPVLIDTGSSNTWVGSNPPQGEFYPYWPAVDTGNKVSISYRQGSMTGEEWIDTVSIGSGLVVTNQSVGVSLPGGAPDFDTVDGILGLGPVDLTQGTVENTGLVPTFMNNLYQQGVISQEVLGLYFSPDYFTDTQGFINGELTFGGIDTSLITSAVSYAPITQTQPAGRYWGLNQTISYGTIELLSSAGVVDSGTTLFLLATDAFEKYMAAIPGATVDTDTGLLQIPESSVAGMESLYFSVGGTTFEFTAQDQLLDQWENIAYGGPYENYYSIISDLGSPSGQGLDFIYGYNFLLRFYSVFDTTNNQVGFATTAWSSGGYGWTTPPPRREARASSRS